MEMNLELSCSGSPPGKPDDGGNDIPNKRERYIPLNLAKDGVDAYAKMCRDYFERKRLRLQAGEYNVPSGLDDPFAGNRID